MQDEDGTSVVKKLFGVPVKLSMKCDETEHEIQVGPMHRCFGYAAEASIDRRLFKGTLARSLCVHCLMQEGAEVDVLKCNVDEKTAHISDGIALGLKEEREVKNEVCVGIAAATQTTSAKPDLVFEPGPMGMSRQARKDGSA